MSIQDDDPRKDEVLEATILEGPIHIYDFVHCGGGVNHMIKLKYNDSNSASYLAFDLYSDPAFFEGIVYEDDEEPHSEDKPVCLLTPGTVVRFPLRWRKNGKLEIVKTP